MQQLTTVGDDDGDDDGGDDCDEYGNNSKQLVKLIMILAKMINEVVALQSQAFSATMLLIMMKLRIATTITMK